MIALALFLGGLVPWGFGVWWLYRRRRERLREQAWLALADFPSDPPPLTMLLRLGTAGPLVQHWQRRLYKLGYSVQEDGLFGDQTFSATRAFQSTPGLAPDGIVGPATWTAGHRLGRR
jgi:hypothetical protein